MPLITLHTHRRAWVTAGMLLLLAACSDEATGPIEPAPPTYDLVVEARPRGFSELYVVPLAGGAPARLFAGEVNGRHAAPSPDGRRIAYWDQADDEIWIVDRVTGARVNVSQFEFEIDVAPTWSPDGSQLAFTSFRSGGSDVYVVNADGSELRNLMSDTWPAATFDGAPAWSPDGSRIAFSSDRDGRSSIYTMRPDGTDIVRVTNAPSARDHEPSWSPDGSRIVFRRDRAVGNAPEVNLAIVSADGSYLIEIAHEGRERYPSWSPDGQWIAFASDRSNNEQRVFTVRADGSQLTERAGGAAFGRHASYPRWIRRL